jgi:uncharacterized membrane protein
MDGQPTLTVWHFPTLEGADQSIEMLVSLHEERALEVHGAVMAAWPPGRKRPRFRLLEGTSGVFATEDFRRQILWSVSPGSSVLFLMTSDADIDRVGDVLARLDGTLEVFSATG